MQNEAELIEAITKGEDDRLLELLRSADNLDELLGARIENPQPTNHAIGFNMTLLQLASVRTRGSGKPASILLEQGAKLDLHSACGLGQLDFIKETLTSDPDAVNKQVDGYFPIQFAITAAQPEVIRCLAEFGDDPNRDLRKVAYFGWEDDTRDQNFTPWKLIHMASLWGFNADRVPVAESLAVAGAELDTVSPLDGYRPIHLVAMSNRVDMIRFFASRGVDVNVQTAEFDGFDLSEGNEGPTMGSDCTPLMVAAAEGFVEATKCLLELGADKAVENGEGQTALDLATNRFWDGQPYDEVIELLGAVRGELGWDLVNGM